MTSASDRLGFLPCSLLCALLVDSPQSPGTVERRALAVACIMSYQSPVRPQQSMDVEVANVKQQPAANDMISYDRSKLRILLDPWLRCAGIGDAHLRPMTEQPPPPSLPDPFRWALAGCLLISGTDQTGLFLS